MILTSRLGPGQERQEGPRFLRTTSLRLRQPTQPASPELVGPTTQGTGAPSGDGLSSAQPRQSPQRVPLACHPCGEHTPVWCPPPIEHLRRVASHQRRLRASDRRRHLHQGGPSPGRASKCSLRLCLPLRGKCGAATFSKVHPRLLNTPACAHAAR